MGYLKEPDGIDFIIKSKPLTNKERSAISEFIADYRQKNNIQKSLGSKRNTAKLKVSKQDSV